MKTRPVLLIHWVDASTTETKTPPSPPEPAVGVAVGVLVSQNRYHIKVAREWFYDGDFRGELTIPKKYIRTQETIYQVPEE